jgi:hypothetical protein
VARRPTQPRGRVPSESNREHKWDLRELTAVSLYYLAATLVLTYPMSLNPASSGPFGRSEALENAWVLSWVGHQLLREPLGLFNAGTFHPLPHTLAFSEHLLVPGIIALPFLALTNDLVLTGNILLIIAVVSSALAMYLLTVNLTGSRLAAILTGLFYAFIPYRFARLHLLQLQFYVFLPLALLHLDRFLETGNRRWSWGFGIFLALQALSGWYLAAMASVVALIAIVTLVPGRSRSGREILALVASLAIAAAVVYPFMVPYLETVRASQTEWGLDSVEAVSADPATYLASSSRLYQALSPLYLTDSPRDQLFPGFTLLLLGVLGAVILLLRRGGFSRPWSKVSCYSLILLSGVILSLGPLTPVYVFLHEHIAIVRWLGHVTRFGFLLFLSLCVMSGFSLAWLFQSLSVKGRKEQVAAAIAAVFLIESATAPESIESLRDEPAEVYHWLARQTEEGALVELPYQARQTRRLFWARHYAFRPSLGGVSRFVPAPHQWMEVLLARFPSSDSLSLLKQLDVRYAVVHLESYTSTELLRLLNDLTSYRHDLLPIRDFGTELVFEIRRDEVTHQAPSDPTGSPTKLAAIAEQDSADGQSRAHDTRFDVRLSSMSRVSGLRMLYGSTPPLPAKRIELRYRNEKGVPVKWQTAPDWPALTELITSLLDDPREGAQTLRFDPIEMERFQVILESSDGRPDVRAIEVLGSTDPN